MWMIPRVLNIRMGLSIGASPKIPKSRNAARSNESIESDQVMAESWLFSDQRVVLIDAAQMDLQRSAGHISPRHICRVLLNSRGRSWMTKELLFRSYNGEMTWLDFSCESDCKLGTAWHSMASCSGCRCQDHAKKTATWQKKRVEPSPEWLGFAEAIPFEDQLLD